MINPIESLPIDLNKIKDEKQLLEVAKWLEGKSLGEIMGGDLKKHSYLFKEGKKKANKEAIKYKYALIKKDIFCIFFNLFSRAKVNANKVRDTPNNVAPFITD